MPAPLNLVGREFGRLTVDARMHAVNGRVYWKCSCRCGGRHIARTDHLMSGGVDHCGCNRGG